MQTYHHCVCVCVCVCIQSVLRLRDEMVAEGRLQSEVVGAVLPAHRHESVTTASQTDLSGEVTQCLYTSYLTVHMCASVV